MKIINQSFEIISMSSPDGETMLKQIEAIARVSYKSEDRITPTSYERFVRKLIDSQHDSTLEFATVTVKIITNRAIANEIVRHRVGTSYLQLSTRYCNYAKDGFGNEITVIEPVGYSFEKLVDTNGKDIYTQTDYWHLAMHHCEYAYMEMIKLGVKPEIARGVLPLDLATELVVSANLRAWRHIFNLRCAKNAHPQIRSLMKSVLSEFHTRIPIVFDDLYQKYVEITEKDVLQFIIDSEESARKKNHD